jgi:hypothetical protein
VSRTWFVFWIKQPQMVSSAACPGERLQDNGDGEHAGCVELHPGRCQRRCDPPLCVLFSEDGRLHRMAGLVHAVALCVMLSVLGPQQGSQQRCALHVNATCRLVVQGLAARSRYVQAAGSALPDAGHLRKPGESRRVVQLLLQAYWHDDTEKL